MSFIALLDYFARSFDNPGVTDEIKADARAMIDRVNGLLIEAEANGVELCVNPRTHTYIASESGGGVGRRIDIFDPHNDLDIWLTDARLITHGLYRLNPFQSRGWCRLTDQEPASGKRTFSA